MAELVEALRPVADGVRKKKYHLGDGAPRPDKDRIQLHLSVAECRRILGLVDRAHVEELLRSCA